MTRTPPHNIDAEEALLGAMLLSTVAVDVASEIVDAADFYRPAHQHVFEAVMSLASKNEAIDAITVAEELRLHGLLDSIGGPQLLLDLQAATPATSSAGRYARIVNDKARLRTLIGVGAEITELGFTPTEDVDGAMSSAEGLMFDAAQNRDTTTTSSVRSLLDNALDMIEARAEAGEKITGTPTGFHEFDSLTAGLQPGSLVVVGARPGMGKTSFAMGMASHAAVDEHRPVLFISLEMSKVDLVQRLLCSRARVDSTRIRNGSLRPDDWDRIAKASGPMGDAPLWIDDNPNATVMDIRTKARRLTSQAGALGMVVVDYIQLMQSTKRNPENRQTEVAEISRGLKILARELECPVVALAQLNRGLEQRADKRPMLSDLRESGCLAGNTRILRADTGTEVTLAELVSTGERDVPVWALGDDWKIVRANLTHAFPSGVKKLYRMRLASGRTIDATANHKFRTVEGWKRLDELSIGDRLAAAEATGSADLSDLADSDVLWDRLAAVDELGEAPVFDATVEGVHNFIGNNIIAHNSLEQDADIVAFLYRDEIYDPNSADRGMAEVLVAKHRAGPTDMVRLAFLPNYTTFANLARE